MKDTNIDNNNEIKKSDMTADTGPTIEQIFSNDITIPDCLDTKLDDVYAQIRNSDITVEFQNSGNNSTQISKKREQFHITAAVAALAVILGIGGTAAYASSHFWSRSMTGILTADENSKSELEEQGIASRGNGYTNLAQTSQGITITPEQIVTDGNFVYLSLFVNGYTLSENETPTFASGEVTISDGSDDENLTSEINFYNGITWKPGTKEPVYDDGTVLAKDDDGNYIMTPRYEDENGNLNLIIRSCSAPETASLSGKTIAVNLKGLGDTVKGNTHSDSEWHFAFTLPSADSPLEFTLDQKVAATELTLTKVSITPLSVRINYSGSWSGDILFRGVILKDGTRLTELENGGTAGFTSVSHGSEQIAFSQVIDPSEVESLIISTNSDRETETNDDLIEVPLDD